MNMTKKYAIKECVVCRIRKHTTNTNKIYVCELCMKRKFIDLWNENVSIKTTTWYKIGKALRLVK